MADLRCVVQCLGGVLRPAGGAVADVFPFSAGYCGVLAFSGGAVAPAWRSFAAIPVFTVEYFFVWRSFSNGLAEFFTSSAEFFRHPNFYSGVFLHPGLNLYY